MLRGGCHTVSSDTSTEIFLLSSRTIQLHYFFSNISACVCYALLNWEAIYILSSSAVFQACMNMLGNLGFCFNYCGFFYILINLFFVVIECVNVLRYLKGRFLSILFIPLGSPLHFTDSQLIVGKGVKD